MSTMREDFEAWASEQGQYPKAVQRNGDGYMLAITQCYWLAYQAATERAAKQCEDVDEPAWHGYECPNTFQDGVSACAAAIRASGGKGEAS